MEETGSAGWCKFVRQVYVPSLRIKPRGSACCSFHHEKNMRRRPDKMWSTLSAARQTRKSRRDSRLHMFILLMYPTAASMNVQKSYVPGW